VTTRESRPTGHDYQAMVGVLADAARRRDAELAAAEHAYRDSAARAAAELARVDAESATADRRAGAAAAVVLDVDREAARLWDQLRRARRGRGRALGDLPEPFPVEALPRVAVGRLPGAAERPQPSARILLHTVATRVDGATRPVPRRPLPPRMLVMLPMLGALVAAATGLVAAGLVTLGETDLPAGSLLRGAGWLAFLVAPSAGVPVAAYLTRRVLTARLDVGGIGLTLLGGMPAATLLSLSFAAR
jgi:hypothetical protein